jgi:hypothetical protein
VTVADFLTTFGPEQSHLARPESSSQRNKYAAAAALTAASPQGSSDSDRDGLPGSGLGPGSKAAVAITNQLQQIQIALLAIIGYYCVPIIANNQQ